MENGHLGIIRFRTITHFYENKKEGKKLLLSISLPLIYKSNGSVSMATRVTNHSLR